MDRKGVKLLMGGGEGQGGVFTWREKNRRKVNLLFGLILGFMLNPICFVAYVGPTRTCPRR
ncbi:hypothetical protein DFH09DRAFT_1186904 [Mycena vulgaris]|nr:hypothetical protein DFH09DRAFT_1186904 [Mycena vulgaris]